MASVFTLLSLPTDVRTQIYDQLFPNGYLISIGFNPRCSLSGCLAILRTCKQLHDEIEEYLDKKPITLYCARGSRPSVVQRVPRRVLNNASVVVIEDSPSNIIHFTLLPSLRTICFCDVYIHPYDRSNEGNSDAPANLIAGGESRDKDDGDDPLLVIPDNNEILKHHHEQWKRLRLDHLWIRTMWKERKDIQVVLRRVIEVEKKSETLSYHTVVDVDSRSILAKSQLPPHANDAPDNDIVYDYGNVRWWRRRSAIDSSRADARLTFTASSENDRLRKVHSW